MNDPLASISSIISDAQHIVVIQADNPDGDSLGSALALEHILADMGKTVSLYCGVDMPGYLRYLSGWDRVTPELPSTFDASIIVDASTVTLLEKLTENSGRSAVGSRPCIVLDHHANVEQEIPFADVILNNPDVSSTGELIFATGKTLGWNFSIAAQEYILTAILGDTQGLSNQLAKPETYRVVADMIEAGVDRPALEELRREWGKMPQPIYKYKAKLIDRTEFRADGKIAHVSVDQKEITDFSPLYNPGPLIQGDMLQTQGVGVAIVFKLYADGKVTGAIRCNPGFGIGGKLATKMGGGGHDFASGFKDVTGRPYNEIKSECLGYAEELLQTLNGSPKHEPI